MTRFVIDPPTLVQIVATGVPVAAGHQIVAPNSIRSRALELLFAAVQAGTLTESEALSQHEQLTAMRMRLLGDRVSRRTAWRLAREQGWESLLDAEYIALARLQADALITIDPRLAARAGGRVPLADLDALR